MATKIRARLRALVSTLTRRTAGERLQQVTDIFGRTWTLDTQRMRLVPPLAGADGEGEGDGEGDGDGAGAAGDGDEGDGEPAPTLREQRRNSPPGEDAGVEEWKKYARAWQDRAQSDKTAVELKRERKQREDLERKLKEFEDSDKSDQEKAIDDAKAEVRAELDAERRHDRLEVAVTRLAARTFADTEDALIHLERAIKDGDGDQDEIFDNDGRVQTDAVKTALTELLERKPHLAAGDGTPPPGDSDAGKGRGSKGAEAMSPADHLAVIQGRNK